MSDFSQKGRRNFAILLICSSLSLVLFHCWAYPSLLEKKISIKNLSEKTRTIIKAAKAQIGVTTSYDSSYKALDYPGGDVSLSTGVCTDVVIRALRSVDFDLQKELHESMLKNFKKYPNNWGLKSPDKNIDHRRVPNLQTFFIEKGWQKKVSETSTDYHAGDIVTWKLFNGRDHIGILIDRSVSGRPLVVHNIGWGAKIEDVLFTWKITGHYRPQL